MSAGVGVWSMWGRVWRDKRVRHWHVADEQPGHKSVPARLELQAMLKTGRSGIVFRSRI